MDLELVLETGPGVHRMRTPKRGPIVPTPRRCRTALVCFSMAAVAFAASLAGAATERDQSKDPAAIIEAIDAANLTDLEPMDFVYEGMELSLGETGSITLSYLRSCRVEQIKGGLVKIGHSKSEVSSPTPVEFMEVDCDGGGIVPTDRQRDVAAGITFRNKARTGEDPVRVFSTAPVFVFAQCVDELVIEPEEGAGHESFTFPVNSRRLDLAEHSVSLQAGGTYRATAGDKSVLFKISSTATGTGRTVVERLIGF